MEDKQTVVDSDNGAKGKGKVQETSKTYGDSPNFIKSGDGSGVGNQGKFGKL